MPPIVLASDYACRAHPKVIEAKSAQSARYPGNSYGEDSTTEDAVQQLGQYFPYAAQILFTNTGTAANLLALQTLLGHRCNSAVCANSAHIDRSEGGGLESLGFKIFTLPTRAGKILPADLSNFVERRHHDVHSSRPTVLSIANATECGTVYSLLECVELGQCAKKLGLKVHLDGARLFHAGASLSKSDFQGLIRSLGVSVCSFGATKSGGISADAVIFFDPTLAEIACHLHKQHGQLAARTDVMAVEFTALCQDGLGFQLARDANARAAQLAALLHEKKGLEPVYPVESNAVFVRLPHEVVVSLRPHVDFHEWGREANQTTIRLMCSWCTTEDDLRQLVELF